MPGHKLHGYKILQVASGQGPAQLAGLDVQDRSTDRPRRCQLNGLAI